MEQLFNKNKTTKKDVFSDPSYRMSQRPVAVKSGEGLGFQDMGSSLGPLKPVVTHGKPQRNKPKPAAASPARPRKPRFHTSEDDSEDELLLGSQKSAGGGATSSSKRIVQRSGTDALSDEETVRVGGHVFAAHPDYKPSSFDAVKALRFKKNKRSTPAGDAVTEVPPPSSSLTDSQDLFRPISDDIEILDRHISNRPSSSRQRPPETSSTRPRSPGATCLAPSRFTDPKGSPTSKPSSSATTNAKPRPRPRVVIKVKSAPRQRDSSPESVPRPVAQKRTLPLRNKSPELPSNANSKRTGKKPLSSRRELQEFPMSLQAKENVSDGAWSGDPTPIKTKKAVMSRPKTIVHAPKPIPLPSPLKTKPVSGGNTFPNLSPLASSIDKGKARAKSPNGDDIDLIDGTGKRSGPKPFPMSSQMLAGIDRRSKSPSMCSPKSTKRASSDDSGVKQGRIAKKRKDSRSEAVDTLGYLHGPVEDDSIELGHARDPSTMCPYCDEELPPHPTPFLQHLLATARKKSVSDPRPRNWCGLRAPLTIYISVCQRHRFELHQLPIATERGWPKTIDFTKVPVRVKKMKKELKAIILDKDDVSDIEGLDTDDGLRGPRSKSVFWKEVKKEVRKQGSRTMVGVKGQFASFERTQPGYYGEQGSVIIHQTLFDLFPPSTFDASLIAPLAPAEFIQHILVPEAAVRLIMQDLCVDIEDAIVTLRESAQYGVAMFPDTSENKRKGTGVEEMGVADQIVMERARARRKELAEEEKVENEMLEEERAAQRARARESRRERALERAQQARKAKARAEGKDGAEDVYETGTMRKTRRGTKQRAVMGDSESDAMSADSSTTRQSTRVTRNGVGGVTTHQLDGSDSDSVELVGDSKLKASRWSSKTGDPYAHVDTITVTPRVSKKSFSGFASLTGDGGHESTPRSTRPRTDTTITETVVGRSDGGTVPLQIARNRSGASGPSATHDGWSRSLRTVPSDSDSDASNASRVSQGLIRSRIKKGRPDAWLFTEPSSSDSS